jgi:hypothetical protein
MSTGHVKKTTKQAVRMEIIRKATDERYDWLDDPIVRALV